MYLRVLSIHLLFAYHRSSTMHDFSLVQGSRCKFSHDLNVGRKVDKKDLYSDARDENGMAH